MFNIIEVNGKSRALGIRAFETERQASINKGNTEIQQVHTTDYYEFIKQNKTSKHVN